MIPRCLLDNILTILAGLSALRPCLLPVVPLFCAVDFCWRSFGSTHGILMAHLLGVLVLLENFERKNVIFMLKQAQIFNGGEHKFYMLFKINSRFQRNFELWMVLSRPQGYVFMRNFKNILFCSHFLIFLYVILSAWNLIRSSTLPFIIQLKAFPPIGGVP